jgi:hypothetical protein
LVEAIMADIPRDPRQLARDILAGKVKIEDLARERQMRGGGMAAPQQQAKIPLPRQVPAPSPPPMQRGPVRSAPMPMPQRPVPQQRPIPQQRVPQRPLPQQAQRTVPMPPPRQPAARPVLTVPAPTPVVPAVAQRQAAPVAAGPKTRATRLAELVQSKHALRQGSLLAEVLGKPKALRDEM